MTYEEIRRTLEKQLQLLSKRSCEDDVSTDELSVLTASMVEAAKFLCAP